MQHSSDNLYALALDIGTTTTRLALIPKDSQDSVLPLLPTQFSTAINTAPIFTPYQHNQLVINRIMDFILQAFETIKVANIFAVRILLTGIAANCDNIPDLTIALKKHFPNILVIPIKDPKLESWLAASATIKTLAALHPEKMIVNCDIGGGTCNIGVFQKGQILSAGSFYIGARHFCFLPGTYELKSISTIGEKILAHLGLSYQAQQIISQQDIDVIIQFYIEQLKSILGLSKTNTYASTEFLIQADFSTPWQNTNKEDLIITFSGGVGELVYESKDASLALEVTTYGDLGFELARGIKQDNAFQSNITTHQRYRTADATLYGLALYSIDIPGESFYISTKKQPALIGVPIIASYQLPDEEQALNSFSERNVTKEVFALQLAFEDYPSKKALCHYAKSFRQLLTKTKQLVLLTNSNCGQILGNLITEWGTIYSHATSHYGTLLVLDEIPNKKASFVDIDGLELDTIPITMYGLDKL